MFTVTGRILLLGVWAHKLRANSADPDQTALKGAVRSGFSMFALPFVPPSGTQYRTLVLNSRVFTVKVVGAKFFREL